MKEMRKCPVCGKAYTDHPALSRKDNKTEICPSCGLNEALEAYYDAIGRSRDELDEAKATIREMLAKRSESGK